MPAASIVISAYNAEDFLEATLKSVFAQTCEDFECIVVDDGSTDRTAEIVKSFNDYRLRYISIPNSGGPARPRNIGMQNSTGDFIFIFDADDLMHPQKLEMSLQAFEKYPQADLVFTNYSSINEQGALLKSDYLAEYNSLWSMLSESRDVEVQLIPSHTLYPALIKVNFIGTSSIALRRSALTIHNTFNETLRNSDDRLFIVQFSMGHHAIFINDSLHFYRLKSTGISSRNFSERGISKIAALKIIKEDCQSTALKREIDMQISHDYAAIAYDYKSRGLSDRQLHNAIKSISYRYNWWANKLVIHALFSMIKNGIFGIGMHGKN